MDESALAQAGLGTVFTSDTFAYVNIDDPAFSTQKLTLRLAYVQLATAAGADSTTTGAHAAQAIQGPLALAYVNAVLTNPAINGTPIDPTGKPRGLAWVHMGKRDLFNRQGSRYVVIKDTLDIYSAFKFAQTREASENVFGDAQDAWLAETLAGPETWKILVSSVSISSLIIDLRDKLDVSDSSLRNRYYLDTDMWDGFPNRRKKLLQQLAGVADGKALVLSGDIHAALASVENGVACLTTPAISSQSIKGGAAGVVTGGGFDPTTAVYKYAVLQIDESFREANPGIVLSDSDSHGFLVVELSADQALATFHLIPGANAETDYAARPTDLNARFAARRFRVTPGSIVPV
jgi:alkaline phosphatase D